MFKKLLIFTALTLHVFLLADTKRFHGGTTLESKKFANLEIYGSGTLNKVSANNASIKGGANIQEIQVAQHCDICGGAEITKSSCGTLTIKGGATLSHVKTNNLEVRGSLIADHLQVTGKTAIYGGMTIHNSSFQDMTISGTSMRLEDVKANNIFVRKNNDPKEQTLILVGNTVIAGKITFESESSALVVKSPKVKHGPVVKGTHTK